MAEVFWSEIRECYLKRFNPPTLVILDAPESMDAPPGNAWVDKHDYNCRRIRELFLKYFAGGTVEWVHLPKGSRKNRFWERIDSILRGKTSDDFVIPYFEGHAAGENENHYIYFKSGPERIKTEQYVQRFYDTLAFCMLIFDCHTHDRLQRKYRREDGGNTEIITTSTQHKESSGKFGYSPGHDFTDALLIRLPTYVEGLVEEREKEEAAIARGRQLKQKKPKALRTIPQILMDVTSMYANANRPDRKRTRAGGEEVIWRFVNDGELTKQTGKIEIFAKLLQGDILDESDGEASQEGEEAGVRDAKKAKMAEGDGLSGAESDDRAPPMPPGYPPIQEVDED